jgi:hypothetical protein
MYVCMYVCMYTKNKVIDCSECLWVYLLCFPFKFLSCIPGILHWRMKKLREKQLQSMQSRAWNNSCSVARHGDQPSKLNIYFQENMTNVWPVTDIDIDQWQAIISNPAEYKIYALLHVVRKLSVCCGDQQIINIKNYY